MTRGFASDNAAAIHPAVLEAIARANTGHVPSYGHDDATARVEAMLTAEFGPDARAFLVFNGSAANVLCLRLACRPWQAVICAAQAHLNVDEGGAPEALAGVKLLTVEAPEALLTPALVDERLRRIGDEHAVQPRLVSVTQSSELGTVYDPGDLEALADHVHGRGLLLHLDGSRLSNAAAALGCSLGQAAAGADLISFGGTKNGLLLGEALIVRGSVAELAADVPFLRKQTLQLASKMRFLAAQFDAYLTDELWRRSALHANAMATRLAAGVGELPEVQIRHPVQANAVFARLPRTAIAPLQARVPFYVWDERADEVRWMCSWDTTEEDVDGFAAAVRDTLG